MQILQRALLANIAIFFSSGVFATEPLHDLVEVEGEVGAFIPKDYCWIPLPPADRLRALKLAERCSAIGGPVGNFKVESGKIWLTSLRTCGGQIPVHEIYPDFKDPALANWLTGLFTVKLGWLCTSKSGLNVYKKVLALQVREGVVVSTSSKSNDQPAC